MATKFYFHDAATTVGGTLPSVSPALDPPSVTAAGGQTNRSMTETIGAGQTSASLTTLAQTTQQSNLFRRFISDPIAAQTIASQTLTISVGALEANAASDMFEAGSSSIYIWRPGTGAIVNNLVANFFGILNEPGTSQTHCTITGSSTSRTSQDGDVIVFELWSIQSQSMGTAYNNQVFYDGTTEGSTSNIASYLNFANTITFASVARVPRSPGVDSGFGHFCKAHQAIRRWRHGEYGILVPDVAWV